MNEQMIGNAQQLVERLGTSDEALRRRIAELEEENRLLRVHAPLPSTDVRRPSLRRS